MKKILFAILMIAFIVSVAFAAARSYSVTWTAGSLASDAVSLPSAYVAKYLYIPDNVNIDSLQFQVYSASGYRVLVGAAAGAVYWQKNDTTNATTVRLDPDVWNQFLGAKIKVAVPASDTSGLSAGTGIKLYAQKP